LTSPPDSSARNAATGAWPTELRATEQGRVLRVSFQGGEQFELSAPDLRRLSPSAEGRGHGRMAPERPAEPFAEVRIVQMSPVGRYAVRISFDDGHDTGLYTWAMLREFGRKAASGAA
jgi:DUF971 family protein